MPRADISMTPTEVEHFLRTSRTMVLVTLDADGMPAPVGMWYVVDAAGRIRMRTYARSQKVVNLQRDNRFAALVETGEKYEELRGVQLTGRVALSRDPELVLDIYEAVAHKYRGVATVDRVALAGSAAKQVAIELRVERTVSWDHRKQFPG